MSQTPRKPLLAVSDLVKVFGVGANWLGRPTGFVRAVNGVSFQIQKGETLGIVGESGCGKSTLGRTILRLLEPDSGRVEFDGQDLAALDRESLRKLRRKMQIIFQDPYAALNPRMKVSQILSEPLDIHGLHREPQARKKRLQELLDRCGLRTESLNKYPHEFSGGQRQRICIARALAVEPDFIVCDEPVSALDVSIQAQIVNLLMDLQKELGLTYLFIAHDLNVVQHISTRVGVMYLGRIVELSEKKALFENPQHPYTRSLLSAIPIADPTLKRQNVRLSGDLPSPLNPPQGCHFHPRCPVAQERCKTDVPPLTGEKNQVACHFPGTWINTKS